MPVHRAQAVQRLHEEVAAIPEGECEDMLVLPIYAALPPELQVSQPHAWAAEVLPSVLCPSTSDKSSCVAQSCAAALCVTATLLPPSVIRFDVLVMLLAGSSPHLAGLAALQPTGTPASAALQARVFAPGPAGCRRVIVATNIAETSVTVEGVVFVVDPGLVKQKSHNPQTGLDSLEVVPISRCTAFAAGACSRSAHAWFVGRTLQAVGAPAAAAVHNWEQCAILSASADGYRAAQHQPCP